MYDYWFERAQREYDMMEPPEWGSDEEDEEEEKEDEYE